MPATLAEQALAAFAAVAAAMKTAALLAETARNDARPPAVFPAARIEDGDETASLLALGIERIVLRPRAVFLVKDDGAAAGELAAEFRKRVNADATLKSLAQDIRYAGRDAPDPAEDDRDADYAGVAAQFEIEIWVKEGDPYAAA